MERKSAIKCVVKSRFEGEWFREGRGRAGSEGSDNGVGSDGAAEDLVQLAVVDGNDHVGVGAARHGRGRGEESERCSPGQWESPLPTTALPPQFSA